MDKYFLYQNAVQCVEAEIDFVSATYRQLKGKSAIKLREDFCGTALTACEWVKREPNHLAWGVDLDPLVLQWASDNNLKTLSPQQQQRIKLLEADVVNGVVSDVDVVLAMNFSYFLFMERAAMLRYFGSILRSLKTDGMLFLDAFGGYEAAKVLTEERACDGFTYLWEQAEFNPINSQMQCHIHFETDENIRMEKAFSYRWRLWTLPEITEMLSTAGFHKVTVYWEQTDPQSGEGNGIYQASTQGTPDAAWVCYIVAEK